MISDEELKEIVRDAAHAHWEIEPEIAEIAQELLQRREAEKKNLQLWSEEDPESGPFDAQGMAESIADNLQDDDETAEGIHCAVRLSGRTMRVWLTGGEDREVHWEWV